MSCSGCAYRVCCWGRCGESLLATWAVSTADRSSFSLFSKVLGRWRSACMAQTPADRSTQLPGLQPPSTNLPHRLCPRSSAVCSGSSHAQPLVQHLDSFLLLRFLEKDPRLSLTDFFKSIIIEGKKKNFMSWLCK